ncbi:MAG: argininosuccinate synthase [Candidatus Bathyarchaeia archaeon]
MGVTDLEKVVLAYSGGLDTSVILKWLIDRYNAEVVTLTVDVGQPLNPHIVEERAKTIGAVRHYHLDAREEFVTNYIHPALKANAIYGGKYPLSTALSRPLIASKLVEVAKKENATAVAHGCTGKGNDQVRFEVTIKALRPDLKIYAPVREWKMSRNAEIEYAREHKIPVPLEKSIYSVDENLWGRSIECGPLENPEHEPLPEVYEWTKPPEKAPDTPEYISIEFECGVPKTVNGETLGKVELVQLLNRRCGEHGVGRIDHIEDRLVGIKSREVYECPAAVCLIDAHRDLEKLVLTKHELIFKQSVEAQWSWLVYNGLWVEPLREDLEAFINNTQVRVEGEVKVKLFKGSASIVGRSSPNSLYDLGLATYDISTTFDQSAAAGFIELWGLPTRVASRLRLEKGK